MSYFRKSTEAIVPRVCVSELGCLLGVFIATQFAMGQTTLFSEGFNTPGDGTRYLLLRDYYEVSQPNNLWTSVPNQLPGDNVIVYLESGDEYFDGSPVPARRATFFGDNDLGDATPGTDLTDDGFALFDAAVQWATDTDGSTPLTINFVIDDTSDVETNNLDVTLVDRLIEQGHEVIVTNADTPPDPSDDLIFMASHDDGSAVAGMSPEFKTVETPLISGFFHAAGALGFGSERGENTNGTYDLQIVDPTHPLAAGFPNGLVQAVADDAARQRFTRVTRGTLAPDAKVVATLPGAVVDVPEDFTGFEGEGYLRGGHSTWNNAPEAGQPRTWQTIESLNTESVDQPQLQLSLAASEGAEDVPGPYENSVDNPDNFDFIRVLTDDNGDGEFDILTEFLAIEDIDSDFIGYFAAEDGTVLNSQFQTFTFDLPSATTLDLRIDVFTNDGNERIGIDDIRVIGQGGGNLVGDCNIDGLVDRGDLSCATAETISGILSATNLLAGDLDADGKVAFADFLILSGNFGKSDVGYELGDIDVNGEVAFADFLTLSGNFGKSSSEIAAVPEPSGIMLGLFGMCVVSGYRRRRNSAPVICRGASTRIAPVQ